MTDWQRWQQSWDDQQKFYLPDREERFAAMLDVVAATVRPAPRVLDLACGPASITSRVLVRFPDATVTGVDVDPVLLAIAHGVHGADARTSFTVADLRTPDWTAALPSAEYDVVLTATALHWLPQAALTRLYADLAGLLVPGGVFCNADHLPLSGSPRLAAACDAATEHRQAAARATSGTLDWDGWWAAVAAEPELAPLLPQRAELFAGASHAAEFTPPARWHVEQLQSGGFTEAAVVWRNRGDAIVAALR